MAASVDQVRSLVGSANTNTMQIEIQYKYNTFADQVRSLVDSNEWWTSPLRSADQRVKEVPVGSQ